MLNQSKCDKSVVPSTFVMVNHKSKFSVYSYLSGAGPSFFFLAPILFSIPLSIVSEPNQLFLRNNKYHRKATAAPALNPK